VHTLYLAYLSLQVHKFLASILSHVVPAEMWGSAENRDTFFTHILLHTVSASILQCESNVSSKIKF